MTQEINLNFKKEHNIKIYKIYKIFSNDLLFYYTISFLFLNTIKGYTASQIVFADAFFPFFNILFSIPITLLISKFGKKLGLVLSNFSYGIFLLFALLSTNPYILIIGNIFCAIGSNCKNLSESAFLYDSLPSSNNKQKEFTKIEGNSCSIFYFVDAITSFSAGFLFIINPYLPLIIELIILILTALITLFLYEIPTENNTLEIPTFKKEVSDLIDGFKFIFKSRRLKALILYNALFASFIQLMSTLRTSVLEEINLPSKYFGIVFSIFGIIAAFSTTRSIHLHEKHKNKVLGILGILYAITMLSIGLFASIAIPRFLKIYLILISISISYMLIGPYYTLSKQYLNSFCKSKTRVKIYSSNQISRNLLASFVCFIFSIILKYLSNSNTTLIAGILGLILMILTIIFMSTRIGLKPEEYSKDDIEIL